MASSTLFRILLSLLFFGLASLCSNAAYPNNNQVNQTPTAYLPKILEEKLTKELMLRYLNWLITFSLAFCLVS